MIIGQTEAASRARETLGVHLLHKIELSLGQDKFPCALLARVAVESEKLSCFLSRVVLQDAFKSLELPQLRLVMFVHLLFFLVVWPTDRTDLRGAPVFTVRKGKH